MNGIKFAIEWIAINDETAELDVDVMEAVATVMLVADIYNKEPMEIAKRVVEFRKKEIKKEEQSI